MAHTSGAAGGGNGTDDDARRCYHLRPKPRQRTDLMGFNSTWRMLVVWLIVIVLAL
jgi:hypothetical protein